MKLTINSQVLAAELRLLNRVVPTKPAIAILSHALLSAGLEGIAFHATDMEVALTGPCQGIVEEAGQTAVPVAKLLQMVEQFAEGDVTLHGTGQSLAVRCGAFSSKLQAMPVDDFPMQPEVKGAAVQLDAAGLRTLIAKTRHAINAAGAKHALKGALLTFVGGNVAMVATDGQRLALATTTRQGEDLDVVVPVKALDVLAGGAEEGALELTVGDRHLFFASGGRLLTSRRLEGKFPSYERIIPSEEVNRLKVQADKHALSAALRRVILTAEETEAVFMHFASGSVTLASASVGIGSANEGVAVLYEGEAFKACVNGAYLLDFLNAASGSQVTLALAGPMGSLLATDGDHLGVIALMRT